MSKLETVLKALEAVLVAALPATVLRNEVLPEDVPFDGLVVLRDGSPGEPEVTLSPMTWHYVHTAEIEIIVRRADNDAAFDALRTAIGAAIAADRRLGGLCDWVEAQAPEATDIPVDGAAPLKAAVVPVQLHYSTTDPLGG